MAKTKPWWPLTIALRLAFWANFIAKLPTYALDLNITSDELTSIGEDAAVFNYLYTYDETFRIFISAFMSYRKNILSGKTPADIGPPPVCPVTIVPATVLSALLNRLFAFVKLLKSQPGMTIAIAKDLKIVGADIEPFVPAAYIANGKAVVGEDGIVINFKKGEYIDGMAIYMQRGSDPIFYEVIRVTKKGFLIDSLNLAPGPETRKFKTRAFVGNTLIGFFSAEFSATWTSPPPPPTTAAEKEAAAKAAEAAKEEPKA